MKEFKVVFVREYSWETTVEAKDEVMAEEKATAELNKLLDAGEDFDNISQKGYIECVDSWVDEKVIVL